jgi:hypothetical protein
MSSSRHFSPLHGGSASPAAVLLSLRAPRPGSDFSPVPGRSSSSLPRVQPRLQARSPISMARPSSSNSAPPYARPSARPRRLPLPAMRSPGPAPSLFLASAPSRTLLASLFGHGAPPSVRPQVAVCPARSSSPVELPLAPCPSRSDLAVNAQSSSHPHG